MNNNNKESKRTKENFKTAATRYKINTMICKTTTKRCITVTMRRKRARYRVFEAMQKCKINTPMRKKKKFNLTTKGKYRDAEPCETMSETQ